MKVPWDFSQVHEPGEGVWLRDGLGKGMVAHWGLARAHRVLVYFNVGLFQLSIIWGELRIKQGGREPSMFGRGPVLPDPAAEECRFPTWN